MSPATRFAASSDGSESSWSVTVLAFSNCASGPLAAVSPLPTSIARSYSVRVCESSMSTFEGEEGARAM